MTEVRLSETLDGDTRLCRYISLDKLINLLSTCVLYFTPLAWYAANDPFEGYLPAAALKAWADIDRPVINDIQYLADLVIEKLSGEQHEIEKTSSELLEKIEHTKRIKKSIFIAMAKTTVVSCWHSSPVESEAMWRLYSDSGKGIAIETTAIDLKTSLEARDSQNIVRIHPVKYLDFYDSTLSPKDCIVDGLSICPLLKRKSYEHEKEVRAFIFPKLGYHKIESYPPNPIRVPIDIKQLIKKIIISPYAREPFVSSVVDVCKKYSVESDVIVESSRLLLGHEELLNILSS